MRVSVVLLMRWKVATNCAIEVKFDADGNANANANANANCHSHSM